MFLAVVWQSPKGPVIGFLQGIFRIVMAGKETAQVVEERLLMRREEGFRRGGVTGSEIAP